MEQLIKKIIQKLKFTFPYSAEEYCKTLVVENYHKHTDFSNHSSPDSAESMVNYAERTVEFGGKCLFSGEHGTQGNIFETYNTANKYDLKYVHSTEAYWVKDRLKEYPEIDKETKEYKTDTKTGEIKTHKDRSNCHMVIVGKNDEGRKDINFALSMANEDGYYYKPRLDLDLLFKIPKDNVFVTSACVAGWKYEDAEQIWLKIHKYFGDNFFLEFQNHNTPSQIALNKKILKIAKKHSIQTICGLDSHYVKQENSIKRDQILKYKGVTYEDEVGWFLDYPSGQEIFDRFKEQGVLNDEEILTAMMNTNIFAVACEKIVLDKSFKIPCIYPNKTYEERANIFKKIINEKYKQETSKTKEKVKGIKYEVGEIIDSGVVDYFLDNEKIVKLGVEKYGGILTTTSRGSSASFIVNKLLGFTTLDRFNSEIPIYPERFLTKERVLSGQMPDIDFNIASAEPFVLATKELLGEHGCYPLLAIEKLKEKASWQLYAGANDVKPEDANQISKYIDKYNEKLKYADELDREFIVIEDFIPEEYIDLYKQSLEYQGITINTKAHACGYLILQGDIRREIGLIRTVSETTGKSVLCVNMEGTYLDDFGYVKNDFLIVDSVHLTHELFASIGRKVPTFDELREMIEGDEKTWDIYKKGITCCVNQCEKASTTKKVMQYKPKNLAELSAFIAGIRPGFKSLLSTFLAREKYSTGEPIIDNLLEDTFHFMIYQESLMKLLAFLGVPMTDAYTVIKSISKKKLKGEKLQKLQDTLTENWMKEITNLDNFAKIWQVFEDSARYAFNSPHALSMGGDSVYEAWFKAHHTTKFYEVAINHYQAKNKKDKIDALIKEAMIHFGYKLGDYEFGKDNRKVNIENNIIYPNMSSIKGFGEGVSEKLYELGKNNYKDFREFLDCIIGIGINRTVVDKLIKLNYFKCFGGVKKLLKFIEYYDLLNGKKAPKKSTIAEKIKELNIIDLIQSNSSPTPATYTKFDSNNCLNEIWGVVPETNLSVSEIINNQQEILGIITHVDSSYSKKVFYVSELEVLKSITNMTLYRVKDGTSHKIKMWTTQYNKNAFEKCAFLYVEKIDKKLQKAPTGEVNHETGKKIYREVEGSFEFWLNKYKDVSYEFEEE
jgi:DNA polymerase III alpha subunit